MTNFVKFGLLAALVLEAGSLEAQRQVRPIEGPPRLALVIGNDAYLDKRLNNAVNDAQAMRSALTDAGFAVEVLTDKNLQQLEEGIDKFVASVRPGDTALFYYSGHGIQLQDQNYLIPVDFAARTAIDAKYRSYPVQRVIDSLEQAGAAIQIIVLDACRDNPYRSLRGAGGGLASMNAGRGVYIALATAPGKTASDNPGGRNGLFTGELIRVLPQKGLSIDQVFNQTRARVSAASQNGQVPWSTSSLVGEFYFANGATREIAPPSQQLVPSAGDVKVNPKDGQRYVWIPSGSFRMGCSEGDSDCGSNEKPAHQVTITKGFWLGQTPITVAAWKRYRAATGAAALPAEDSLGRKNLNEASGNDNMPVVFLTWEEASNFCSWGGGRLPTEAEWELAARAGGTSPRYGALDDVAWYADTSGNKRIDSTALWKADQKAYSQKLYDNGNGPKPVGLKQPNAWNLYDMLGNVWQWTADWYSETGYQNRVARDPLGPPGGEKRALRGGSWYSNPAGVRVSCRIRFVPAYRFNFIGGRCLGE